MKKRTFIPILTFCCLLSGLSGGAQNTSILTHESLSFSDLSNPLAGAFFNLGGINIQNGFNFTTINDNSVSAGNDLIRSKIDGSGFTIEDFAVFPTSNSNLNRKQLTFETEGAGLIGLDRETWRLGITNVGEFDPNNAVQSAFSLRYNRIIDDIAILYPIFYVNPQEGNMGMGTFDQNFQAQLYVEEFGQDQVGVWSENVSISNSSRWGMFSSSEGTGSGVRYGVVGQGQTSTGTKYGIYGQTSGSGTRYAVYANGDMAYTGTLTDVSDRKFKKKHSGIYRSGPGHAATSDYL